MDNETKDEIAEIVQAGLSSGTSMQTIVNCIGQLQLKKWVLYLGDQYEGHLKQAKRK